MKPISLKQLMKAFLIGLTCLLILFFCICITPAQAQQAQCPDQSFVDSCAKSFRENIASRELIKAQADQIVLLEVASEADSRAMAAKDDVIAAALNANNKALDQIGALIIQVEALAKLKCDSTRLFFGLVRKVRCR
jgi:hypothetical protein